MGLDQYFYRVKTDMTTQQFSNEIKKNGFRQIRFC